MIAEHEVISFYGCLLASVLIICVGLYYEWKSSNTASVLVAAGGVATLFVAVYLLSPRIRLPLSESEVALRRNLDETRLARDGLQKEVERLSRLTKSMQQQFDELSIKHKESESELEKHKEQLAEFSQANTKWKSAYDSLEDLVRRAISSYPPAQTQYPPPKTLRR